MENEFVNLKIRKKYRDLLKEYSKKHGVKMYALVELLIKEKCNRKILSTKNLLND